MSNIRWTVNRINNGVGVDEMTVSPISLYRIALAAAEETLQGGGLSPAFLTLFRGHLSATETYWLRWGGDLAESAELRRAFSGLYGRYFARALLSQHLGISRFVSLKRDGVVLPSGIQVKRNHAGDIPDWLAWDDKNSKLVLCEAKGSLTGADFGLTAQPKCVAQGKLQFDRVDTFDRGVKIHPGEWVAATRWSTDARPVAPWTILWDPPTKDDGLSEKDVKRHRVAITRAWLDSIAPGFGYENGRELTGEMGQRFAVTLRAAPGAIPENEEWPTERSPVDSQSKVEHEDAISSELQVVSHLLQTPESQRFYKTSRDRDHKKKQVEHVGQYLVAVVTRFGIRPVRSMGEFDSLIREQKSALALREPAMIIGLPTDIRSTGKLSGAGWLGGGGIARSQDLSLFDLRRVEVQPVDTTKGE